MNNYSEILITLTFIVSVVILTKVWSRRNKPKQLQGQNDLETLLDRLDGNYISITFVYFGKEETTLILSVYDKPPRAMDTEPIEVYYCVHPEKSRLTIHEGRFSVRHTKQGGTTLQRLN